MPEITANSFFATGDSPERAIKEISERFRVSKHNAGRLVMTESSYFSSAAQKQCFNELEVERYEIVGTFDKHMCPICGRFDGKVLDMKEFKEGITAPPFHPNCRCCTSPYFEELDDVLQALQMPEEIRPIKVCDNGRSQKFKGKKCYVTVNPDTGILIQTNPRSGGSDK